MKDFMPEVRRFKFGKIFRIPFFSKVRVECRERSDILNDNTFEIREVMVNLSRRRVTTG